MEKSIGFSHPIPENELFAQRGSRVPKTYPTRLHESMEKCADLHFPGPGSGDLGVVRTPAWNEPETPAHRLRPSASARRRDFNPGFSCNKSEGEETEVPKKVLPLPTGPAPAGEAFIKEEKWKIHGSDPRGWV